MVIIAGFVLLRIGTDQSRIKVGIHQGSALRPLLFMEVNHRNQCYLQMIACFVRHPEKVQQVLDIWGDPFERHGQ